MCGCLLHAPSWRPGLQPQACALTGSWTGDPLVRDRHSVQGWATPARAYVIDYIHYAVHYIPMTILITSNFYFLIPFTFLAHPPTPSNLVTTNLFFFTKIFWWFSEELEKGLGRAELPWWIYLVFAAKALRQLLHRGSRQKWKGLSPGEKVPIWKGFVSYSLKLFDGVANISLTDVG